MVCSFVMFVWCAMYLFNRLHIIGLVLICQESEFKVRLLYGISLFLSSFAFFVLRNLRRLIQLHARGILGF